VEEFLSAIELALIWLLNGLLVIFYVMLKHILALLIIPALTLLTADIEENRRPWMMAAGLLSVVAAIFSSLIIGVWLILMAYGSILAILVEKFNRPELRWRVVGGLTAYGLIAVGVLIYQELTPVLAAESDMFVQGQTYLDIIISVGVWGLPAAFLGFLVQRVLVHPPEPQAPGKTITQIRTRGRK